MKKKKNVNYRSIKSYGKRSYQFRDKQLRQVLTDGRRTQEQKGIKLGYFLRQVYRSIKLDKKQQEIDYSTLPVDVYGQGDTFILLPDKTLPVNFNKTYNITINGKFYRTIKLESITDNKTPSWSSIDTKDNRKSQCQICYEKLYEKARYSLFNYCRKKGYIFLEFSAQDSFNDTLIFLKENPAYIQEQKDKLTDKQKDIPEYGLMMRKLRENYRNDLRRKHNHHVSVDEILSGELTLPDKNTKNNFFKVENHFENIDFYDAMEKVFNKRQFEIAKLLIEGYNQQEISQALEVNINTIYKHVNHIKNVMQCGILEFAK